MSSKRPWSFLRKPKNSGKAQDDPPEGVLAENVRPTSSLDSSSLPRQDTYGLQLLYDGTNIFDEAYSSEEDAVDIIAVHGMNGHPIKTFTDASGCCWLKDLLPGDFPHSRVFSYGWNSDIFARTQNLQLTFTDEFHVLLHHLRLQTKDTSRPIIFISHAFGGLLVKRTVVEAKARAYSQSIYNRIKGVMFFGTPHRGSSMAKWSETILKMIKSVPLGPTQPITESLQRLASDSGAAMALNQDFPEAVGAIRIVSFYETLPTKGLGIIVEKDSAIIGLASEKVVTLNTSHIGLCKFAESTSSNYQRVIHALRAICQSTVENVGDSQNAVITSMTGIPRDGWIPNVASKVGKTAMGLLEMAGSMEDPRDFSNADVDIVAIHGLGGSPSRSWINNEANTLWLRDFLQADFPTARIMSYGYIAEAALVNKSIDLSQLASDLLENVLTSRLGRARESERPIIFIGYSFGGLILKKALLLLKVERERPEYWKLFRALAHTIFLGVPHDGDDPSLTSRWTGIVYCTTRMKNIEAFDTADVLIEIEHITKDFCKLDEIYAATITESEPTRFSRSQEKTLIVSAQSARLGWADRESIFVAKNRNHINLPTFIDAEDPAYAYIRDTISKTLSRLGLGIGIEETGACLLALRVASGAYSETRLETIAKPFPGSCDWIFSKPEVQSWLNNVSGTLLIEGPPGCGKSVLAKHLFRQLKKEIDSAIILQLFFDIRRPSLENPWAFLLYQLCRSEPNLVKYPVNTFRKIGEEFASSPFLVRDIFSTAVVSYPGRNVVILLDGADEYQPISALEDVLDSLVTLQDVLKFRLAIVSRPVAELERIRRLPSQRLSYVNWESAFPIDEIRAFVKRQLSGLNIHRLYLASDSDNASLLHILEDNIVDKVGSSFLLAFMMLADLKNRLESGASLPEVRDVSSFGIRDLENFYDDLLRRCQARISREDWTLLYEVILLLLISTKSMTIELLVEALQTQKKINQRYSTQNAISEPTPTISHVRNLLTGSLGLVFITSNQVQFCHTSFVNYLLSFNDSRRWDPPILPISYEEAHLNMARRCISSIQIHITGMANTGPRLYIDSFRNTFAEYAVTNWIYHFSMSQDMAEESLWDSVYNIFDSTYALTPLHTWWNLYIVATNEKLPRLQKFGPLFGGAYFGLRKIVERALQMGADIEAQDDEGKTALHWAAERGYTEIVAKLLQEGSRVDFPAYSGWTALHFAAQKGNKPMVLLLLEAGADINAVTADGRGALHISMELGRDEVVELLLDRGSDASQKAYNGLSLIHLATTEGKLEMLMRSSEAASALFRRSIYDNDISALNLLIQYRLDIINQAYPWVSELRDEGFSHDEISDLLLKSENLDWIESDSLERATNEEGLHKPSVLGHTPLDSSQLDQGHSIEQPFPQLKHHRPCVHQLTLLNTCHISGSSSESYSTPPSGGVLDPEHHYDELSKREQGLLDRCGIGGVFAPGRDRKINPGFARMRLNAAQIIYGDPRPVRPPNNPSTDHGETNFRKLNSLFPIDMTADIPVLQYKLKDKLEEDSDKASLFSIGSDASQRSDSSYDSVMNDDNFEIWDQTLAIKTTEALVNVLNALCFLHCEDAACERFTILVKLAHRDRVIEVKSVIGSNLVELWNRLRKFCEPSQSGPSGFTKPLADACLAILGGIGFGEMVEEYFVRSLGSGKTISASRCLHISALITQVASISLVTYSRGHSREFYTSCLTRPIDFFLLGGSEDLGPSLYAERVDLACMGKMLGRKVWIFHQNKTELGTPREPFFLSTSIDNLLDTWGGWVSFQAESADDNILLHTGGGYVVPINKPEIKDDTVDHEIYCHWTSANEVILTESLISKHARLLIGATSVNDACPLTFAACQTSIANKLGYLGTRPPSWKTTGRSIGFSGGKFVNLNLSGSQTRDDGRNLKKLLIDGYQANQDLRKLNCPWGLEISLCTGIARRVLLRHLLHGEVLKYLELGLPGEWKEISTIAPTIFETSDEEFEQLLNELTKDQAEVLKKATELLILAMEETGVQSDGHTLKLWWPERNEAAPRCLTVLKSQYSGKNPWIPMIKDSEHCAVFGLATLRCLQHDDIKTCRQIAPPQTWRTMENIMLVTILTPAESEFLSFPYSKDARYLIYKGTDILRVTRPRIEGVDSCVVQLNYIASNIIQRPPIVMRRLMKRMGGLEMVREKQGLSDPGQGVIIL